MNTTKILNSVDRLHANAVRRGSVKGSDGTYTLEFDGRCYASFNPAGNPMPHCYWNTRSVAQAKRWLRDWLNS